MAVGTRVVDEYDSVLVISDTHIGLSEKEIFGKDFEQFTDALASTNALTVHGVDAEFQFEMPKAIILMGDYLDFWDGDLESLPKFAVDYGRILVERADVFYLRGNHDYIVPQVSPDLQTKHKFEISEYKVLKIAGKPYFFIHGHQFESAFGSLSLKIESSIDPFYSLAEYFASKLVGKGRAALLLLTALWFVLGITLATGRAEVLPVPECDLILFCFGLLFLPSIFTCWRWAQKTLFKGITLIFGEAYNRLQGATRGDTIDYLTGHSRPIYNWFVDEKQGSSEAKNAGFVCFGHTHIPDGPTRGTDEKLKDISFLNTGSWMRPPSETKRTLAKKLRSATKRYDKWDEYVVIAYFLGGLVFTAVWRAAALWIVAIGALLLVLETLVAVGKSSYLRLPGRGVRSIAFIGRDSSGTQREVLLYWDPKAKQLQELPHALD